MGSSDNCKLKVKKKKIITLVGVGQTGPTGSTGQIPLETISIDFTGGATFGEVDVILQKIGQQVFLAITLIQGSAAAASTIVSTTSIPAQFIPPVPFSFTIPVISGGTNIIGSITIGSNGVITIGTASVSGSQLIYSQPFSNTGLNGWPEINITYTIPP